ncbi:hypothetical protein SAMN04488111_1034 [Lutibacter flavus]|uniref:Uncharacterized protein n=1 Tax=Lutibacter flavus TaxID=691689 RepID=A0A238VU81_9FLAO|nr:hypothetical protein SAMN04488111_1034 [Lutibacter flavus]
MDQPKYVWKKEYSAVLIANAVYIILFYLIMNSFS